MSRASNLAGFTTSITSTTNLSVGVVTATSTIVSSTIVGSAVTINSSGINATAVNINSRGLNVTGVVTATSFVGSGANLTGITAGVTTSKSVGLNFFFGY